GAATSSRSPPPGRIPRKAVMGSGAIRRSSPLSPPGRTAVLCTLALVVLAGAGFPEVVRVQVPSEKVPSYFPPGTELRGMALEEFEGLVAEARAGFQRQQRGSGPRLLRAQHFARWEAGTLLGRSELLVEA